MHKAPAGARARALTARARSSSHVSTERLVGHYIGDPQVYRDKEELHRLQETRDPITLLRERLGSPTRSSRPIDREVHEIVEASVEFAKAGTDPKPEDALKNVYA